MVNKKLYENFHSKTKSQRNVVTDNNFTYHIILDIIKKYIDHNLSVLDIGCGAGTITLYIASHYQAEVLGIDISDKAVKACIESSNKLNLTNVKFKRLDFPMGIPSGKYDVVLCFEVIEHINNDRLAIHKIYDLLNKNGVVILSTPSANAPLYRLGLVSKFDKKVGHLRRYTSHQLVRMFEDENFKIISVIKTEGILRNFLFVNTYAGKLIKLIRFPLTILFNVIDHLLLLIFGEADLFIVARKP